jgi:short-subunit dehydrogenase
MSGALDLFRLDGKVAVVTGGSKGIGAIPARRDTLWRQ